MRVSVVIPTYNSAPLVVEAVESVLAQTVRPYEVIVVDDGSSDDTSERLAKFGDRIRYVKKENGGVSSARNRGVAEAVGEWVAFLDADDVWHSQKLEIQLASLAQHPDVGVMGTAMYDWPTETPPPLPGVRATPQRLSTAQLAVQNVLATSTIIALRDVLQQTGGFDQTLQGPEDFDLWLRISTRTVVAFLSEPLTGYRLANPNSLSKNAARMESDLFTIHEKLKTSGVIKHRSVISRKMRAYIDYSCGLTYRSAGRRWVAAHRFLRSLLTWPFTIHPGRNGSGWDRVRMLGVTLCTFIRGR